MNQGIFSIGQSESSTFLGRENDKLIFLKRTFNNKALIWFENTNECD